VVTEKEVEVLLKYIKVSVAIVDDKIQARFLKDGASCVKMYSQMI